ncbi:MAG TPA: sigma-54-dependent Fis family transcriptional regulator [Spirochaetales bacterium]|nr:sigma-54-dependent Fis family transcriptional regulator [Spirochaetales bacterium]
MKYNILVVDDEKNIREGLGRVLELDGYRVFLAADGREGLKFVERRDIDLVISDLKMPGVNGEELLKQTRNMYANLPVIILTGHGTVENAVQAMKDGAYDFLTKPINLEHFAILVKRALSNRELILQHRHMQKELEKRSQFANIIGKSAAMHSIFEKVRQVAPTRASVLITGESGVGKEVIAEAIHYISPRKDKPLVKVHCAALTETLLESELFGHERGAFTGAVARKRGRFELANLGSLFLDEIGEISQSVQIKLLRVLQDRKFERVGGEETIETDIRIIASTNRNLMDDISTGKFREDLYYRLNVINIHIPPLRERNEDIPLLVAAFLEEFSRENEKNIEGIETKARLALYNYSWPGNVRELRNCIESAVVMSKNAILSLEDLPPHIGQTSGGQSLNLSPGISLAEGEKEIIRSALNMNKGNKSKTAEVLGIGRKTLHRKIQEYSLEG